MGAGSSTVSTARLENMQALRAAIAGGDPNQVALLLCRPGSSANASADFPDSPLHLVCNSKVCAAPEAGILIAKILLEESAFPNALSLDGSTPLFAAATHGHEGLVRLLLAHRAAPNDARDDGATPLLAACSFNRPRCVRALLEAGASLDQPRRDGATPLCIASIAGHANIVRLLCAVRCDISFEYGGKSALVWAEEQGDAGQECASLIREASKADAGEVRMAHTALRALQRLMACRHDDPVCSKHERGHTAHISRLREAVAAAEPLALTLPRLAAEVASAKDYIGRIEDATPPVAFVCSITQEVMLDPVVTADGHTYERSAITEWLKHHNTSPNTGEKLVHRQLTPNVTVRGMISAWEDGHPCHRMQLKPANLSAVQHLTQSDESVSTCGIA
mmetsp:Transcript_60561/g.100526  ORF Transcript_60561/g.100526 Transcript_60561/m.100526 type:complete len:393 (-) Transcript_60561:135-1313(-)